MKYSINVPVQKFRSYKTSDCKGPAIQTIFTLPEELHHETKECTINVDTEKKIFSKVFNIKSRSSTAPFTQENLTARSQPDVNRTK
jgi:hypothetical protein